MPHSDENCPNHTIAIFWFLCENEIYEIYTDSFFRAAAPLSFTERQNSLKSLVR